MKYYLIALIFLFNQTKNQAQDCQSAYSPMLEDTKMEMTNYDKKGRISSISKANIYELTNRGDTTAAKVHAQIVDEEGEEIFKSEYEIKCLKGIILLDMRDIMGDLGKQFDKMDVSVEGNFIEYPDNMTVGTKLPDAEMVLTMNADSPLPIKIRVNMVERKVEAQESITTSAGTFDCLKLTYSIETKMGFSRSTRSAVWLAKGVGTVRTESYDKKGNVDFKSELTKFEK
jgi:hypothetical protein